MSFTSEKIMSNDGAMNACERISMMCGGISCASLNTSMSELETEAFKIPQLADYSAEELEFYVDPASAVMLHQDCHNQFCMVLGYQIVEHGANLSGRLRDRVIEAAEQDLWAKDSPARKQEMESFIDLLNNYKQANLGATA